VNLFSAFTRMEPTGPDALLMEGVPRIPMETCRGLLSGEHGVGPFKGSQS
jgi:hypothetical protein